MVLGRLGRILRQRADDLPYPQVSLLLNIANTEPVTPSELAASERVSLPSVSRSLYALIRSGYVVREQSAEDRRASVVRLTNIGREESVRILHTRDAWLSAHLERLTDEEVRELVRLIPILEKLCAPRHTGRE
jgi:DNA-binding MarR family transcriptional regulator